MARVREPACFGAMPMPLHVLTGPTAVGKTERALRWAEERGGEILSCDSLLFYRGMDIGTAKPTRAELARVPHHLIDVCEPDEQMDIGRYVALARAVVADCEARGVPLLITGGSGFYLQCFFGPVTDGVEVPEAVRAQVRALELRNGLAGMLDALRPLCPDGLADLDIDNPRRVSRALERSLATGRSYGELKQAFAAMPGPFAEHAVELEILDRPNEELDERIARRVEAMLASGLVEEVKRLRAAGFEKNPSGAGAIGYREVLAVLDGKAPEAELAAEIVRNTRALVRKQRTWFRKLTRP